MSQLIGSDETPELDGTKSEGSWVASHRLTITQEGTSTEYVFGHGVTPDPSTLVTIPQGFQLVGWRSEEHTSELQSLRHLVCGLLLEKKKD